MTVHRGILAPAPGEFDALWDFMEERVKPTPNPFNSKQNLLRRQCTFSEPGSTPYSFGQGNDTFSEPAENWPSVVKAALDTARHLAGEEYGLVPSLYNAVHCNLYPCGKAGVRLHRDDEPSMVRDMPIFSFTMLSDAERPRDFSIYKLDKATKICDIPSVRGTCSSWPGRCNRASPTGSIRPGPRASTRISCEST